MMVHYFIPGKAVLGQNKSAALSLTVGQQPLYRFPSLVKPDTRGMVKTLDGLSLRPVIPILTMSMIPREKGQKFIQIPLLYLAWMSLIRLSFSALPEHKEENLKKTVSGECSGGMTYLMPSGTIRSITASFGLKLGDVDKALRLWILDL